MAADYTDIYFKTVSEIHFFAVFTKFEINLTFGVTHLYTKYYKNLTRKFIMAAEKHTICFRICNAEAEGIDKSEAVGQTYASSQPRLK